MTSFHSDSRFTIENNILKGKEVSYHDDYDSIGEFILASMENDSDAVGQIDAVTGKEYTFGIMRERSVRCALWMQSQGLRLGDIVAVCSRNHMDLAISCAATLYLGAIFNPWNAEEPAGFIHRMNSTKPKLIFASEGLATLVAEASEKAKLDVKIIVFGRLPGFLEFDSVIVEPEIDEVKKFACTPIKSSSEIALIIFTSGSTGLPKGVAQSHAAIFTQFHQSKAYGMAGHVVLNFAPMDWINGIHMMLWGVLLNATSIVTPIFEENSACAVIEKYKATWVYLYPSMINRLVKSDAVGKYDLSSVARVHHSGSRLFMASYQAFTKLLPKTEVISGYGSTEFGGKMSVQTTKSPFGSCGQILENFRLKVIEPDTGRILGPNQNGEVLLKSASMMSFYHNDPEGAAKIIDPEGWLHSGDLGYYDETGEIFIVDRMQDAIRYTDYTISPSEIESVILSYPGVKEVAVVGQERPQDDELLIAFVVRTGDFSNTGKQVTGMDIVELVASKLQDSRKHLQGGVRFIDHMPRTATGKIRRAVLRDMARSMGTI